MNNFGIAFKKFITNKNTVTIIGIILILVLLYFGYERTVKKSVDPIRVPVAAKKILERHEITNDDISYVQVSRIVLGENVLTNADSIVGKYTNLGVTIPEGSMFYEEWLVGKDKVPGLWIEQVDFANGEEAYYFNTDSVQTFGNSVLPGSYIDIYMEVTDENNNLIFGKFLENIKVLAVHDGSGRNVFDDPSEVGSTSYLGFALSHEFYILLQKAERMTGYGINLVVAPQGINSNLVSDPKEVVVGSETLRDYIDAHSVYLQDEHVEQKVVDNNDISKNTEVSKES